MWRERGNMSIENEGTINTQLQQTSVRSQCELDKPVINSINGQMKKT